MDHFICYAQASQTKNRAGKTVSEKLFNDFVLSFGFSNKVHDNLGKEFENCLLGELKRLSGVQGVLLGLLGLLGDGTVVEGPMTSIEEP